MRTRLISWATMALTFCVIFAIAACQPQQVTVEKVVTREITRPVEKTVVVEKSIQVEKTVVVTALKTVQVVVTSTPSPVPEGGFITRAIFGDAKTMNPLFAADPSSRALCELMFEGLLAVNPFTGVLEPHLAQGWTASGDGLTYTFAIRQGLLWSDGEPITAHDFYFTYQALLSNKLDTPHNKLVDNVASIQVLDNHTVAVTFNKLYCANLEALTLAWLPAHFFVGSDLAQIETFDFAQLADHEFNSWPAVVSGPFILQEWKRGERIVQMRNERYWQGAPHLEGIVTEVLEGQAALVGRLKSQQIDIGADLEPHYLPALEMEPPLNVFKFLSDGYDFIGLQLGNPADPQPRVNADGTPNQNHGQHPILSDVRVRYAIAHALDRNAIINAAYAGQAIPLNTNVLPTVSWAYNTDVSPREYDRQRAIALLEEAGWQIGASGVRVKAGRAFRLKLYTNTGNAARETIASQVQSQLREVGIDVEVVLEPWEYFLDVLFEQTFDLVVIGWSNLGIDPDDIDLWSAGTDLPGRGRNFCSYVNPELEANLAQARALPGCNQDARAALYKSIQAQLAQDQPYVWLDVPRKLVIVNSRIGGVNPGPWSVWHHVHEWYIKQ
ncbi:MAG: hypothetical protein JW934_14035 [Anaerolineae bacterium]|nr:hypothetical protein [Anaerolineae bacterium]